MLIHVSLNPCCNGRWSRTLPGFFFPQRTKKVLILVVMEDGLVRFGTSPSKYGCSCLNPCCNGRWSRTRPYKTLLIINKLKNLTKEIFTFLNLKLTIP